MPESVTFRQPTEGRFHAVARAPKRSTPRITVEYNAPFALLALDFGVGEPGQERKVLEVNSLGEFQFPEVVPVNELLSFRDRGHLPGEIKIMVHWEDPT